MRTRELHTSVSSVLSSSVSFPFPRLHIDEPVAGRRPPFRWMPALSRSSSDHWRIEARRESISKRFESPRGVVKKDRRTFVTRRRSTFVSVEERRRRRRASIRCSFMITAGEGRCGSYDGPMQKKHTGRTFVSQFANEQLFLLDLFLKLVRSGRVC